MTTEFLSQVNLILAIEKVAYNHHKISKIEEKCYVSVSIHHSVLSVPHPVCCFLLFGAVFSTTEDIFIYQLRGFEDYILKRLFKHGLGLCMCVPIFTVWPLYIFAEEYWQCISHYQRVNIKLVLFLSTDEQHERILITFEVEFLSLWNWS